MADRDQQDIASTKTSKIDDDVLLDNVGEDEKLKQPEGEAFSLTVSGDNDQSLAANLHYGHSEQGTDFSSKEDTTAEIVQSEESNLQTDSVSVTTREGTDSAEIEGQTFVRGTELESSALNQTELSSNLSKGVDGLANELGSFKLNASEIGLSDDSMIKSHEILDTQRENTPEPPISQETFNLQSAVDKVPTDIALSGNSVSESAGIGTVVGTLSATDADSSSFSYSIVSDPDSKFTIDGNELKLAAGVDAESATSHSVTVEVTDGAGNSYQETFSIGVSDVDDTAATDIALNSTSVSESAGIGTVVGTLSATDADSSSFSYSIVSDPDSKFTIDGNELKLAAGVDAESATSHSVTVEVTDGAGNSYQETFSIGVSDVDDTAATDIALNSTSVSESAGIGTVVGTLSATDADSSSFSYSIVSDPDSKFTIDGNELKLAAGVDAESATSHSVTVEVTDGAGNSYQETFSIGVSDVDDTAATDIALSSTSVSESAGIGTVVGTLSATDADSSSFSYSIVSDPDSKFTIDGNELKLAAGVDAESATSHSVTVEVTDGAGNSYQETFSIGVSDVDDTAATDIALSSTSVSESAGIGTVVGTLSATDADSSSFSYSIVSDPDSKFTIDGNELKLAAGVDYEQTNSHSVTVEVTDGAGNSYQETFSIGVSDVNDTATTDINDPGDMSGATLIGTSGDDVLSGTVHKDEIWGIDENDVITGSSQADTVVGGEGNDVLSGGNSGDILYGGAGQDVMDGDTGADTLYGGSGSDNMAGGQGTDTLYGTGQ
ncbi:cadherin repeat domain-containing protein [Kiloniella sp. EL199]|uniref:cadherin repeat domain-containing protein n=1 Tax=Kiloniella sp. EL199 TaxID=2107581 RepID=UPI000EA1C188|nr:cadherin repeat domain-containing protein [Kiloniella sp. EL199]